MFGDINTPRLSFAGPGLVELRVELTMWKTNGDGAWSAPTLQFRPRAYSLSTDADLSTCAEQGQALIDAATFGCTLLALLA